MATILAAAGALAAAGLMTGPALAGAPSPQGEGFSLLALLQVSPDPFPDPFASLVSRGARAEPVGSVERYVTSDGARAFLLENDGQTAQVKFLCGPGDTRIECAFGPGAEETILLRGARGPRGDVFFKTRDGVTMVRMPEHGGPIVTWPGADNSIGAVRVDLEPGDSLRLAPETSSFAARRANLASAALLERVKRPIIFSVADGHSSSSLARPAALGAYQSPTQDNTGGEASVLADAVVRAAAGIDAVARDAAGKQAIAAHISAVRFVEAAGPALALDGKTLVVSYDPGGGLAGRPSSDDVARFLEDAL